MKTFRSILLLSLFLLTFSFAWAEENTQTIRGVVLDSESEIPLIGATVVLDDISTGVATVTDIDGRFRLEEVPIGRHNLFLTYIGYENKVLNNLLLISGKELVLKIEMEESAEDIEVIEINANKIRNNRAVNSFATTSSRTFSVEETGRYAAASFDPARMAQNYAGVSVGSGSDLYNEIVIRGNSPTGVLWRLNGIEIPNPNHFGEMGNSGGAISMLSSSTLSNSDFYTGAFPAEFGNATAGVFDLKMRNGNNEKREYSFMLGALGLEAAAEGPFKKGGRASYLFNYRYSTLAVIQAIGISPTGDILPTYQDLSFNLNFPTEKFGTLNVFGLAGNNLAAFVPAEDSLVWEYDDDNEGFNDTGDMATIGIKHKILMNDDSYLHTVASGSYERSQADGYYLDENYKRISWGDENIEQTSLRLSSTYHRKLSAKSSMRVGAIVSQKDFKFNFNRLTGEPEVMTNLFDNKGQTAFIQGFGQFKHDLTSDLTFNGGLHYSLMTFNNAMAIEPRVALTWAVAPGHDLSFSSGLHSKMEHLALYTSEGKFYDEWEVKSKENLGLSKSFQNVLGYDFRMGPNVRLKAEAYYQHLFNIPVDTDSTSRFSVINGWDIWDYFGLPEASTEGRGRNIGLDLTLEKYFSDQYYFLVTGSVYDSKFSPINGEWYNTRFNGNYQLNTLGGKEFYIGKKKKNILGLNSKLVMSGGNRYTPIDLEASKETGETVVYMDRINEERTPMYFRLDLGTSFKINSEKMTHTIMFDIQNVFNRQNIAETFFNEEKLELDTYTQTGFFPFFNYRIEF